MEPVIATAVVTVAISVVNGIVKMAQRRLNASVEIARITEEGQTDRVRCLTGQSAVQALHPGPVKPDPAGRSGGDGRGGCRQH
ncbi:hypothetical protein [Streptomyces sp. B21-083]|uniref:hypothetical protein n=1 Tax=Streptomyces sp. B21-083 TaxID=3039410 RepID=UPI002FEFB8B4